MKKTDKILLAVAISFIINVHTYGMNHSTNRPKVKHLTVHKQPDNSIKLWKTKEKTFEMEPTKVAIFLKLLEKLNTQESSDVSKIGDDTWELKNFSDQSNSHIVQIGTETWEIKRANPPFDDLIKIRKIN